MFARQALLCIDRKFGLLKGPIMKKLFITLAVALAAVTNAHALDLGKLIIAPVCRTPIPIGNCVGVLPAILGTTCEGL